MQLTLRPNNSPDCANNSAESLDDLFSAPPHWPISKETWDSDAKKARQLGDSPNH